MAEASKAQSSEDRTPHFRVSPAVLGPLGVEQLQDPALAVLELIKNSWDADATNVQVTIKQGAGAASIIVHDDGHGMTLDDFRERWLVIGNSHKRAASTTPKLRPFIGEKGLGRLASFALGNQLTIQSAPADERGFVARVDWGALTKATALEDYEVPVEPKKCKKGTQVEIRDLRSSWTPVHTTFLVTHAQFLTSVPGQTFNIALRVDEKAHPIMGALGAIDRLAEAIMELKVDSAGKPLIVACTVNKVDTSHIAFRDMKELFVDKRLAGMKLSLRFFRKDSASKKLGGVLEQNEVKEALDRYQGVRIFRDGINVPPYGINGDDWAALEKQRTATGGPTFVPGNSQLVGELHLSRRAHSHLVVTAGRSGFTDQTAVTSLGNYVRWAVRELGTARRAERLGLLSPGTKIPARVDDDDTKAPSPEEEVREALAVLAKSKVVRANPALHKQVVAVTQAVKSTLHASDETLRLYAQLASTGIAATSFAHELRTDFDVVSDAVSELSTGRKRPDKELLNLLIASWSRIQAFAGLFKVIPVKIRRKRTILAAAALRTSAKVVLGLAPPDKVRSTVDIPDFKLTIVPAEIDAILLNLVSNATKAIAESPNRDNGRIWLRYSAHMSDLKIRIADNGCGVTPSVRKVMFEPLEGRFSEGTGMGLPIVRYIAGRYGGDVEVSGSTPKGYSTEILVTLSKVVN